MSQSSELSALGDYLSQQAPDLGRPLGLHKFTNGQSNPTFRLSTDCGEYVLRRKPPGDLLSSAHAIDREYRVMDALSDTVVPVPVMRHYCEDVSVLGSEFFIMDYVEGRIFWDPSLPDASLHQRSDIYRQMIGTLAALHAVDPTAVDLADFGGRGDFLQRQYRRWLAQYRAAETEPLAGMEQLIDWLPAHTPADAGGVSLVHGDYRLDNMIIHPEKPTVLAVLDWELSTLGYPVSDLAYVCVQLRLPADAGVFRGLGGIDRDALGLPSEAEMVSWYVDASGRDVEDWNYFMAFCLFRLIAIVQGVRKRALDGNASSSFASRVGELVHPMSRLALEVIA